MLGAFLDRISLSVTTSRLYILQLKEEGRGKTSWRMLMLNSRVDACRSGSEVEAVIGWRIVVRLAGEMPGRYFRPFGLRLIQLRSRVVMAARGVRGRILDLQEWHSGDPKDSQ